LDQLIKSLKRARVIVRRNRVETNYHFSPVSGFMVNRQYGFVTVFLGPAEPIFLKFGTKIEKTKLNFSTGPKFDKKWIRLN